MGYIGYIVSYSSVNFNNVQLLNNLMTARRQTSIKPTTNQTNKP